MQLKASCHFWIIIRMEQSSEKLDVYKLMPYTSCVSVVEW